MTRHKGRYLIDGPGRTVEHAVKMRRLPKDRAMDSLLRKGLVSERDVERLSTVVAEFHRKAETGRPWS